MRADALGAQRRRGTPTAEVEATRPEHYIDVPEAVGVFDGWATLQAAMYDLLIAGFSCSGILLWLRCSTPEKERLAQKIMVGHSGRDVHVHRWSEA